MPTKISLLLTLGLMANSTSSQTEILNPVSEKKIDHYVYSVLESRKIPAAALAIVHNGKIEFQKAYGFSSLELRVSTTVDTVFQVASNTKAFTAVAIQMLVEQNNLSLEDTLGKHLNDIPNQWKPVTIKQLLQHTSGIPNISTDQYTMETITDNWEDAIKLLKDTPLEFEPGSRWQYNATNMLLLDRLIEVISGKPFDQFMAEQMFTPLQMTSATFGGVDKIVPNRATHYTWFDFSESRPKQTAERKVLDFKLDPIGFAGAGLNLSIKDFTRWLIALQEGEIINKQHLQELLQPTTLSDGTTFESPQGAPNSHYGLCWVINNRGEQTWVGGTGGLRSAFAIYPKHNLAIIVLTNLQGSAPEKMVQDIAALYFN